jgi:hypothetical protein
VFDFILHTAYIVDPCAITSILPSLSLIDMIYYTAESKAMLASIRGIGVEFHLLISLVHDIGNCVVTELRDSVVLSVVQTVMEFERIG